MLLFSTSLDNRSCLSCPLQPLCVHLSYKDIELIQLFKNQYKNESKLFFTLRGIHELFLNEYIYDREDYSTFYNTINYLATTEGILLKIDLSKEVFTFISNKRIGSGGNAKKNDIFSI